MKMSFFFFFFESMILLTFGLSPCKWEILLRALYNSHTSGCILLILGGDLCIIANSFSVGLKSVSKVLFFIRSYAI